MNNPIEPGDNLEQRIEQIEREMKRVRFALDHIKLDTGAARESLDTIEQRLSEALKLLRGIGQAQPDHSEKLDTLARRQQELKQEFYTVSNNWLESLQENVDDLKSDIQTARGSHNERFDRIDTIMATKEDVAVLRQEHGDLLRQILDRLLPKQ